MGGEHGLAVADAQKIVDVILKKQKFWSDGKIKKMGALAILDIRARIEASQL